MADRTGRDELVRRVLADYGAGLWRLTSGYARSHADREDLYQDILLAVLGALPSYRGESSLRTFVYRIGHNQGIGYWRRRSGDPRRVPLNDLVSPAPSPESEAIAGADRARLSEAIRRLAHGRRQVLMLHLEGLDHAEIAEVLGITPNNVGVRLHRARAELRRQFDSEHETGE